jgi:hypothetical protein
MPRIAQRLLPLAWVATAAGVALAIGSAGMPARAAGQSTAASRQSEVSLDASVEVPAAAAHALSEGARFSIAAVDASAHGVAVTLSAIGTGASLAVKLSAEQARDLGLSVGAVVVVTAVATGWLVSTAAGRLIAFIPDERTRRHMHSRKLGG